MVDSKMKMIFVLVGIFVVGIVAEESTVTPADTVPSTVAPPPTGTEIPAPVAPPSKPDNPSILKTPECISCLDEGKKYYSELLPEFKKFVTRIAHYEALQENEIPQKDDLVNFYKFLKRFLIGAAIFTANKDYQYKNYAGEHSVLFDLKIIKEKIEELDEFYYDRILGHDPTLKTKAKTVEFYKKINSKNDKHGYLKKLTEIFNSYDFPLHVPAKKTQT